MNKSNTKQLQKEPLKKFQKELLDEFLKEDTGVIWWCHYGSFPNCAVRHGNDTSEGDLGNNIKEKVT